MKIHDAAILIVEDEPYLQMYFEKLMKRSGCLKTATASNGVEAIELVQKGHFDVLISDINMPLMDGIQLVREIRDHHLHIPSIVFVSGHPQINMMEMFDLGVEEFLAKPFRPGVLIEAVHRVLTDTVEMWLLPMNPAPQEYLAIAEASDRPGAPLRPTRVGRGGFSATVTKPVKEGPVNFAITLGSDPGIFTGQGIVRAYSPQTRCVAVQIEYLSPDCRDRFVAQLRASSSRSFIPRCAEGAADFRDGTG